MSDPLSIRMAAGPIPVDEVVRIGYQLAHALTEVHGELWPSMIAVSDDAVEVISAANADRTRYGQYAAPERILGNPATPSSDVFSIAAILYHAVAGHPPFRGDSPTAVMLAACSELPRELPPRIPNQLRKVLMRALSKDPADRYTSPASFADVLSACANVVWDGHRVLAADDDAPIRELYQLMLTRIGVAADIVSSGRDAVEALKTRRYDVALLDLNLPRLSGWEVLDFLRTRNEIPPRHLFIVTGFADQHVSAADRDLVAAVLYKPVVPEELRMLVTECLRGTAPDVPAILRHTSHRVTAA
jgi:CheY-like chemotaxis protein